jgi:hypothetical protein
MRTVRPGRAMLSDAGGPRLLPDPRAACGAEPDLAAQPTGILK